VTEALGPSGQKDEGVEELKKRGKKVRHIIMDAEFPEEIAKDIRVLFHLCCSAFLISSFLLSINATRKCRKRTRS
jgi:hypothetical protein